MLRIICLGGSDPQVNLAYEEAVFERLRIAPAPAALFYVNHPCVVLGRSNEPELWAHAENATADGIPVLRRFSGGGAVYHDEHVLNYSFIVPKSLLGAHGIASGPQAYIDLFRELIISALTPAGGIWTPGWISDILLNGRKISGNAQRISSTLVLHHGTLLLECPLAQIERYLPVPPNRPGIAHRDFLTGLKEEHLALSRAEAIIRLAAALRDWVAGTC